MLDDIDHLLDDAITLHEEKKFFLASVKYLKILEQDASHADTNHNFGLLKVDLGLKEEALIFLQTAINTNPNVLQYWVTFINTLTNVERFDDAGSVLEQANLFGHKDKTLNHLRHNLDLAQRKYETLIKPNQLDASKTMNSEANYESSVKEEQKISKISQLDTFIKDSDKHHTNILDDMKLDKALKLAKRKVIDGLSEEAKKIYQDILVKFPKNKRALDGLKILDSKTLANTSAMGEPSHDQFQSVVNLYTKGQYQETLNKSSQLLEQFPNSFNLYNIIGAANKGLGLLEEAVKAYNKALDIKPNYANAYYNMGIALQELEKLKEAIEAYNKALAIKPDYPDAHYNMGNALLEQGELEEAIEAYNKALSIKPDYPDAHYNMGNAFREQGKLDEAMQAYNRVLSIEPDYVVAYNNMGIVFQEQGKVDEAIQAYTKALSIKPDYADLHRNFSSIKKYTKNDKHFLQVQEFFKQRALTENDKCHFSFALAKMYEDIGELHKSYGHLSEGNRLRKKLLKYSINQDQELFTDLKRTQPQLLKSSLKINEKSTEATPIFILGMPRSGTTLVEQIISSHSEVLGVGELNHVSQLGLNLSVDPKAINTAAISKFRTMYLSELSKVSDGKLFVTDKMPGNFRFIPLICAAFPEAKIIHVERNAIATCWSNFKQYFVSNSLGYCYDLMDVVEYYNLYKDLIELWQSQYSDKIYNLNYENLTTDQENQTRKLIKHLELSWEEACLSPHKNKRSVRTASQQQVRQKVYKGSSETWRKYEPYLNGAFDSLKSK